MVLRPALTSPVAAFSPTKSRPVHSALQRGQRRLFGCERKKCCVQMLCRRQGQSRLEQRWPCEPSVSPSVLTAPFALAPPATLSSIGSRDRRGRRDKCRKCSNSPPSRFPDTPHSPLPSPAPPPHLPPPQQAHYTYPSTTPATPSARAD